MRLSIALGRKLHQNNFKYIAFCQMFLLALEYFRALLDKHLEAKNKHFFRHKSKMLRGSAKGGKKMLRLRNYIEENRLLLLLLKLQGAGRGRDSWTWSARSDIAQHDFTVVTFTLPKEDLNEIHCIICKAEHLLLTPATIRVTHR